ncbi:arylsulfatase [Halolactibacillus alkaliphilus]|uniref:Arylsulfatase n=1 Tax=Halolactibacillus alkaliphilus TaxID=442899 RepID=A0A511WWY9_9BACI|nr:arylsulfatase [Halolactibacillus alkaliphilus]GEN55629.1 arylsulfatase [Halolactibacillus alkaliphilus]GGN63677.1 arylsulfatase [Halolactibacillus alkaliphilus]SFO62621.1 Arylsulfatase A [Halolactibacillus alkaliphilus]
MKPNIVMIMVDQMRYDCLSILGHPVVDTPYLDQLARTGTIFKNAYAATPSCVPARASLLTGMSQVHTGRVGYEDKLPWDYSNFLPEVLGKAGYYTQAIGKMHVYPTRKYCGFDHVELHDGYMHYNRFKQHTKVSESFNEVDDYLQWLKDKAGHHVDLTDLGLDCNSSTVARPWALDESLHPTNWVVTRSIDFLRRRDPTLPFFLKMSFVRPHPPLDPPPYYFDMYLNRELPEPTIGDWADITDKEKEGYNPVTGKGRVPADRYKRAQAAYYGLITHIDHQIGRFLMALEEHEQKEHTIIMFVSDHGELMGDHHLFRKSLPYEGSAKIPLILSDPGNFLKTPLVPTSQRVTELRDVMPTILDILDIPIPPSVDGKSILPLAKDKSTEWRDYLHGEHEFGEKSYHYITTGKEKYIWFSQTGEEQYFDLVNDPQECINHVATQDYQDKVERLRQVLIKELTLREEGYTDGEKLLVGKQAFSSLAHIKSK